MAKAVWLYESGENVEIFSSEEVGAYLKSAGQAGYPVDCPVLGSLIVSSHDKTRVITTLSVVIV